MIIQNNMRGGVNDIGFLVKKTNLEVASQVCREMCREVDAQGRLLRHGDSARLDSRRGHSQPSRDTV